MKFELGEQVRVVSAMSSPFWGWVGKIVGRDDGAIMTGQIHYLVDMGFKWPLLFHETWLAFAGESESDTAQKD